MSISIENLNEISLEENFIEGTENTTEINTTKKDDIVYTADGDDVINTGKGDDIVVSGDGDDVISAGKGDDIVFAGEGDDIINAGKGDDVIDAGDGDDVINAGKGDDIVLAGDGDDTIHTGKGDDIIDAGDGDDLIKAGKGDDILIGGAGDDILYGGKGDDTAVFSGNFADYTISDGPTSRSIYVEDIRENSLDGKDTVYSNVETLQFADGQYNQSTGIFTEGAMTQGIAYETDPVSVLYVQSTTGELTQILESDLLNADGTAVDISTLLNGGTLLVAYTIPNSETMTLGDLLDFTTILHPEMFSLQELPIMTTNGSMTSMVDINAMMSGMMSMFMGLNMPQLDGMPMSEDMMSSFMPMMESFMGSMPSMGEMPIDDFMQMMQGMMDMMMQDGMMDDMSAMTESMMLMMQESMSMMPMESFSQMMTTMLETFPAQMQNSENPLEDMSQAMGAMMLTFMADMNGTTNENAIAEFGSSMGEMLNQFMFVMGGGSEDPSAAIGTMMGEMMGSMMTTMADGAILSMNSFSSIMSNMMNDFMGDMAGMSVMLMGMGDFEAIIAQMQEASSALGTLEDMLPSNLYVQMTDGSLVNIRETELMSADSMSVDITQFLGGSELLVGYTIPSADIMNVSDLLTLTTLTQNDLFAMSEMPMFTLESGDASMTDMSVMLTQMMGMFTLDADGMPMGDGVSDAFIDMMQNFMSMDSMSSMPVEDMMGMMSEMMTLMSSSENMDMMMAMPEAMMSLMQESMNDMPLEEISAMMSMMMQTFTDEMISSEDPMVDMSNSMGSMMFSFMDGMTGGDSLAPAQDFALSMGEMVNQFMVAMTGSNEDPAAAMGDMLGSMMNGIMSGMTGMSVAEGESSIDAFSSAMNQMMSGFMDSMAESSELMMDPMTEMLNSMMSGTDGAMSMFTMMFESINQNAESMIEMSPELIDMMLGLSSDIGSMADEINNVGSSVVDMQVVMSSDYLALQASASELLLMMSQDGAGIETAMGSEAFTQMMAGIESVSTSMTALEDMGTIFPSNLFVQDETGMLLQISETDLQNADGSAVDISSFVNADTMMVAYTIPTTSQMSLGNLLDMTTMLDSSMFSMQDLPMIPTDAGMISVADMSTMMNSMMSMFMGGQFLDAQGMPLDMNAMEGMMGSMMDPAMMESMLTPMMSMMESFMSGMDMESMMPMMEAMSGSMIDTGMMDSMAGMMDSMMEMMSTTMSAMPIAQFGDMMGVMMDTFTEEFTSSDDPFANMANTMGSMMYEFMNGMTGNDSEAPAQEFALTMGEMMNQFMVGMTGGNEDPAQIMGDMMGSMMGGMMAGMTGDSVAPLESFTTSMSDMMGSFMTNMSTSMVTVMNPMTDMMNTMMSGMDANMAVIASMFEQANDTAGLMIEQSPLYMETILRLSDDIGSMADNIGDMADNIVDTQVIQSSNFLQTQDNALELIETLMSQETMLTEMMGAVDFNAMMASLEDSASVIGSMFQSMSSMLYVVDADGIMSQISEADLSNAINNSVDIEQFLNGSQLLVGYTIPNTPNMTLGDMMAYTSVIEDGYTMPDLPMFSLSGTSGDTSVSDMSAMMNSMMGMFLGAQTLSGDDMPMDMSSMESMMSGMMDPTAMSSMMDMSMMDPVMMETMMAPMMEMMNSFMGGMDMPMDEFNTMMQGMMDSMMNSGMMDSMAGMMDSMMEMMSTTMSAMPIAQFGDMMGVMMDTFTEEFTSSDDPFANMANTMGSMMYEFMNGMTGNDSEAPAQEFALTMGEMMNQFMVGMTGGNEDPAQIMGDMMGSMMGGMMAGMTGDSEAPLESFTTSMSNMMGSFMTNMSTSMVTVMNPMTDMMNTMMSGMDANMAVIASMFEQANDTAGLMIEQSPLYMETILRLSDDIGSMADNIGDMADNIVDTQVIQSSNFLQTQDNALELIETLMSQETMLTEMMGQMSFDSMMGNFQGSVDMMGSLTSISESFPSTLYMEDIVSGEVTQLLEADMLNADGSSVDISNMLNGNDLLVAYTIPNAQTMDLGSLLSLTTMIEGGAFSLQDLPMIPTDDGSMISVSEMSTMMNTMMGMFMGSQMTSSTDGMPMDMASMETMMDPFMDMMGSFMGGMDMDSMMPMMNGMMETMMGMMSNTEMMDSMTGMSSSMMDMMSTSMSAMPIDSFGSMAGTLMDTFTQEILLDGNPMDNMANTMGSMMYEFMNGMTGNDSEAPAQEFALTMGEMINQFMVGVTGGNENPAAAMGDMMGSMMGGMMAGMTGDSEAPLDSFTITMSNMMGSFMTDMATSAATVMAPMDSMLNTFVNGIDGNMVFIESMFNTANDTALSLIEQSPEYMTTILRLSDDIGLMADRINEMGDRIVDIQVIQSENFLATQDNTLALIEMLTANDARFIEELGTESFNAMMTNLTSAQTAMDTLVPTPEVSMDEIFATQLYIQDADGSLVKISEEELALADGSTDISSLLLGGSLLVGYTIPNAENMNLAELISMTTMIQSSGMDMSQMPMFSLSTGDSSVMDMSGMMESMMGMFMGSGMISTDDMSPDMMTAFSDMMNSFMGGMDMNSMMDMDQFNTMMSGMMDSMMNSGMTDSMMDMSNSMMDMMGDSMSSMPMDSFSYMMSSMMSSFGEMFTEGDTPMDAMAHTMGSMMLEFMSGMTGNDSEAPAQEFARTMGEMMNQFMVGVTGTNEDSASAMGDMMGSMMGSFMTSITGDAENPMESFANSMSNMMGSMMIDMSESAAIVMDPMADMMNTFLVGIDGNMEFIASMFDTANGTMQSMIALSPEYMETILRLSDDIGLMAGRIDEMADKIVDTIDLQSTNFEITQTNALELINMLNANSAEYMELLGETAFSTMMADLGEIETSLGGISERVNAETATIFPSDLYIQDILTGELVKMSEADMMAENGSYVDITQLLDINTMMVAYTIPMNETMTLSDLMTMTTIVEDSTFSMEMLPMFGENNSIIDINSFMNMALNPETLSMMSMPVDQFNESMFTYQEQMAQSDSPFDAMGQTMGSMMMSFMEGMTDSEGEQTPLVFAQTMGEMVREFMIGATGSNEEPAAAMGEMMGSMMGSFMSSMTANDENPMTQFTGTMSNMMHTFSEDMTQSMLTMMDPTTDLMNTVVNGINGNMDLIASMFETANGTVQALIEQSPVYLDTMVRLSDDIGLMADRINDMADKIVETEVILSETFLSTQSNSLEVISSINEQSEYFISLMGQAKFDAMMANFNLLDTAMGGAIGNMTIPDNSQMSSTLYVTTADGELISMSELELKNSDGTTDITAILSGATLLLGYTIPSLESMTLSELVANTTIVNDSVTMTELPMFTLDGENASVLDMSEMMSSMMSLMMGQNMGIPLDELVSEPFMSMMESFANGMGLEVDTFMMMMNQMMDTMMISDMMDSMANMANQMIESMSLSMGGTEVDTFNDMMGLMMNTFMADGSPMATMADMMGSMMMSMMGEITPGDNDTIDSMAFQMGSMMQAFFVGVTGVSSETGSPAMAMGDMMGSMMNSFMSSVTGSGESFADVMQTMMDRFMSDMSESMMAISEPMMDSINTLLNGMDSNMELLSSMMAGANETIDMALELTPEYIGAMTSLSNDIVEMASRVDEMVDKIDITAQLQLENMSVTQDNISTMITTLGENPAFTSVVENLVTAKNLILPQVSIELTDVVFDYGIMNVIDLDTNELFSVSSFDLSGNKADLYEHDFAFTGGEKIVVEFNESISGLSFNVDLSNYISIKAYDSNNERIVLDSSNFNVASNAHPATISIDGVNDLKYISLDGGMNSAFTMSLNSFISMNSLENNLENIIIQGVPDIPQELVYTVSSDQAIQSDTVIPLVINGESNEVTIPQGQTSIEFSLNIQDDVVSQELESSIVSLEVPSEDALYSLDNESSEVSSSISDVSNTESLFDIASTDTSVTVELFSLIEQDVGILDLTNSLDENVIIDTSDIFKQESDNSLNSMLSIIGNEGDSIEINQDEWNEADIDSMEGFQEYVSINDITVILQVEDDLTIV